ncbi:Peptide chain release factor subunit 1 [Candidatus Bilamarchaeum dharawalense]|uniref:Peptide chain release factor subunit 1 n=1 Tax=Candidatus Bilamarchaeum dharawalense TaxID=2885759 RepID=A0A5E4LME9_9ARCH|nr:Peptide chain release factor subunit 1 [Candidatus Bilamarchaeum dharawalense]
MYHLRKQLRVLEQFHGSGTELISVYIPSGSPVHEMNNKLREEMSQASNIKSKSTKLNVLGALERIMNHLKLYKKTPPTGIAVFAGNVSENSAKIDIQLFTIEPPEALNIGAYRCDSKFFLEPLQSMMGSTDSYGIVVLDGREAIVAIVKGTNITVIRKLNSTAHAKIRKGGQSARRYERLIEEQIEVYYKRVGVVMDDAFVNRVKGVIVGGPGPTKDFFMKMSPFNYQIKILGVVDTGYTDEYGIREVLSKSENILAQQEAVKEKILIDRFIKGIVSDGLAIYGEREVREAIISRQAEKVLLSEGLTYLSGLYKCSSCSVEEKKVFRDKVDDTIPCKACNNGQMKLQSKELLIDDLDELAKQMEIPVEIVSTNTVEGAQFLTGFGGVGAFLRYRTR